MAVAEPQWAIAIALLAIGIVATAVALLKSGMLRRANGQLSIYSRAHTKRDIDFFDPFKDLPQATIVTIQNVLSFRMPESVLERLRSEFPFTKLSDEEFDGCVEEFKKFITVWLINREVEKPTAMVSELIDEVWHTFVLFTEEYHRFSALTNFDYIHHSPSTKARHLTPAAVENFYQTYRKYFGELSPIWMYRIHERTLNEGANGITKTYEITRPPLQIREHSDRRTISIYQKPLSVAGSEA